MIYYTISFFLLSNITIHAQHFVSYYVGITSSTKSLKYSLSPNSNLISQKGIQVGLSYEHKIYNWLAIKPGIEFVQKNTQTKRDGFYEGIYLNNRNSYSQIPLIASINLKKRMLTGFLDLGIYNGYWLSGRRKGILPNVLAPLDYQHENEEQGLLINHIQFEKINRKYEFESDRDSRYEFGYIGGVGLKYRIFTPLEVVIQGRHYYAVTSTTKNSRHFNQSEFNETTSLTLGLVYQIKTNESK